MACSISEKKTACGKWLAVVMLLLAAALPQVVQGATLNAADDAALVALYNATGGAGWTNNTGWSGATGIMDTAINPPYGVTFDGAGRVTDVVLNFNNLAGDISALDLSGLSSLTTLRLYSNTLLGTLPTAAQLPSGISTLDLGNNQLTGGIPDYSAQAALINLSVGGNQLSGSLPTAAQLPAGIIQLLAYSNQLTGSIPDYHTLTSLRDIYLYLNQLSGSLPTAGQLPAGLGYLDVFGNQLSGAVPDYSALTSLTGFRGNNNMLSGSLPSAAQLPPGIQSLWLSINQLTGNIPDYSTLTALNDLNLSYNQLSGSLPTVAQLPPNLMWLYLQNNQLTSVIPDYSVLTSLSSLGLTQLNIQGPTPAGVLAMTGVAKLTTTPAIDPALEGKSFQAVPVAVTGFGGEVGGEVLLQLDGADVGGTFTGGVGEWSVTADLTGLAEGTHTLTVLSYFDNWPGFTAGQASTAASTPITIYIDTTPPVIILLGSNPMTVSQGAVFVDPGATVTDDFDTSPITRVTGSLDVNTVGSYTRTYYAIDDAGNNATPVTRTVNVTDQTAPVITLLGDNPMSVTQGGTFTDPGATVTDNVDTGLVASVTGTVDIGTLGSYILTYSATDSAGNAATQVTRTVDVVAATVPASGGGGGAFNLVFLLLMLLLTGVRDRNDYYR